MAGGRGLRMFLLPALVALLAYPFVKNIQEGVYETKNFLELPQNSAYKIANLPQGKTAYRLYGNSADPLIVLVHGFSSYSYVWDTLVSPLVDDGYQVLLFDLYGRGYSDTPVGSYNAGFYASQLANLLYSLDETRNKKITIVGHSMGGGISVTFAYNYPHLIERLVIGAPAGFPIPMPIVTKFVRIPILSEILMTLAGRHNLVDHVDGCLLDRTSPKAIERMNSEREMIVKQWDHNPPYRRSLSLTLQNFEFGSLKPLYEHIGQTAAFPVTLIWGEKDEVVPFEIHKQVVAALPNAQFVVFSDLAHDLSENPSKMSNEFKLIVEGKLDRSVSRV